MNQDDLTSSVEIMRAAGVEFDSGLTEDEFQRAESTDGFRFPPDLRMFLGHAMPVGEGFPNWRKTAPDSMRHSLKEPEDGICFDVESNDFWFIAWGPRPSSLSDALDQARREVRAAPILIPVYSHRFLPADPCRAGNPVFSIVQTDIICYGVDLKSYLINEFQVRTPFDGLENSTKPAEAKQPVEIEFWSELTRLNC